MSDIDVLAHEFILKTAGGHGELARPNGTHYSTALVTEALAFLRRDLGQGGSLNEPGERFVAGAAAYLATLARASFEKRGFDTSCSGSFEPGNPDNHLAVVATRMRNGKRESYAHDFLGNVKDGVLLPSRAFPVMKGRSYILTSLSLPAVESLFLSGVHFMVSPFSVGNWAEGEAPLASDEDFDAARSLLVGDLLQDLSLPDRDPGLRRLSHWVVWPLYGWDQNDGQEYNMMTLVDQIVVKKAVAFETGVDYLRALMRSQAFCLRNLGARTLMVLGIAPATAVETRFYSQALNASDQTLAVGPMVRFRWLLEGQDPEQAVPEEFAERTVASFHDLARQGPLEPWYAAPIFADPEYAKFGAIDSNQIEERLATARSLVGRHPGDWFAQVALGHALLMGPSPDEGEAVLKKAVETSPGDPVAHFTLAGAYSRAHENEKAHALFTDAVALCPWDFRAVGNFMWSLTKDMTHETGEVCS